MMRRFGLRDDQWERVKDLLPGREGSVGVTAAHRRSVTAGDKNPGNSATSKYPLRT